MSAGRLPTKKKPPTLWTGVSCLEMWDGHRSEEGTEGGRWADPLRGIIAWCLQEGSFHHGITPWLSYRVVNGEGWNPSNNLSPIHWFHWWIGFSLPRPSQFLLTLPLCLVYQILVRFQSPLCTWVFRSTLRTSPSDGCFSLSALWSPTFWCRFKMSAAVRRIFISQGINPAHGLIRLNFWRKKWAYIRQKHSAYLWSLALK